MYIHIYIRIYLDLHDPLYKCKYMHTHIYIERIKNIYIHIWPILENPLCDVVGLDKQDAKADAEVGVEEFMDYEYIYIYIYIYTFV